MLLDMVQSAGDGFFVLRSHVWFLQPTPVFDPQVNVDIIDGGALVRLQENVGAFEATMQTFSTGCNQVIVVDGMNKAGGLVEPIVKGSEAAGIGVGAWPWLIRKFPGHDGGFLT